MKKSNIIIRSAFVWVFILGLFHHAHAQKNTLAVTKTIEINASKQVVMDVLRSYNEFPEWSPFLEYDPNQKYECGGTNGTVGSTFSWLGVDEKSEGTQTIAVIENNDYIKMDCKVLKPFKANSIFAYTLTENSNGSVTVTQNFSSTMGGFSYFMANLFGAEEEIAQINELGLSKLKSYVESKARVSAHP